MNPYDQSNLKFLLQASDETFQQFLEDSDDDDIDYAIELIQTYKAELMVQELDLEEAVDQEHGLDLTDAQTVLNKFRL